MMQYIDNVKNLIRVSLEENIKMTDDKTALRKRSRPYMVFYLFSCHFLDTLHISWNAVLTI